jgi:hypothetical protein
MKYTKIIESFSKKKKVSINLTKYITEAIVLTRMVQKMPRGPLKEELKLL